MRISPLDVHEQTFRMTFRGFDPVEVDAFLQRVADELERLTEERDALRAELVQERETRKNLDDALAASRTLQEGLLEHARGESELVIHQAQLRADRILAQANEDLVQLTREVKGLQDRKSLWLAELEALATTLQDWVEEKGREAVEPPSLIADDAADPGEEQPGFDSSPDEDERTG